jgi:F-type H+-transporting ATPase subunit beta
MNDLKLNVELLRQRVPNLTVAAASAGLRPATVSNLCTGKVPLGRAEIRTLVALADLAECSVDELIIRGGTAEMLETGIKTIDLFAPLIRGGLIGFVARPGMGQLVVLAEIFHRMNVNGFETVFLKPKEETAGVEDVIQIAKLVCSTTLQAFENISNLGKQNIFLAADRQMVLTGEIYSLLEDLREKGILPTTLLVDLRGEAMDEHEPYGPLDTLWQFDAELASRGIFPAINPLYSTSVLIEGSNLDKTHLQTQQLAKKLLRRYRELRFISLDKMPSLEKQIYQRGLRLESYLSQPFLTTEEFTKRQGKTVPLQVTISDVQRIINGEVDTLNAEELLYIGKLS